MGSLTNLGFAGVPIVIFLLVIYVERRQYPHSMASAHGLPWAGIRNEFLRMTRASMRQLTQSLQTLADGYDEFGKNGRAFFVPDISFKAQVFLPQEHIKWLVTLPESVLSVHKVREEKHALRYLNNKSVNNSADAKVTVKFIDDIIGRCLTKQLYRIQADMYDEIRASVDEAMGTSEKWHEVNLGQTMETVAERTGSRALFGMTVCRNREYLHNMSAWNMLMGLGVLTVGQAPRLARPFIATMINLPLRVYKARVMRILVPFIQTRMQDFERGKRGGSPNDASNDFATQAVKVALGRKDHTVFEDPNVLAEQFILLAFAALSTTSVMGTNVFVDILNTDPDHDVYSTLRDEAAHAFPSEADWSDPAALSKLVLINSAVRETLRTVPMAPRGLLREVLPEAGLTLPEGKQVPRGTWVGAPIQAIHMDDRFYDRPARYDPFRFARTESESDAPDASQTSDTFLSWGHGRSACPGRWFATQQLKLLVAYVALNYDIEPMHGRPRSTVLADYSWPLRPICVRVRRRKRD